MDDRDKKDLEQVRAALRKAAEIEDPKKMWFLVRDAFGLLTLIVSGPH